MLFLDVLLYFVIYHVMTDFSEKISKAIKSTNTIWFKISSLQKAALSFDFEEEEEEESEYEEEEEEEIEDLASTLAKKKKRFGML